MKPPPRKGSRARLEHGGLQGAPGEILGDLLIAIEEVILEKANFGQVRPMTYEGSLVGLPIRRHGRHWIAAWLIVRRPAPPQAEAAPVVAAPDVAARARSAVNTVRAQGGLMAHVFRSVSDRGRRAPRTPSRPEKGPEGGRLTDEGAFEHEVARLGVGSLRQTMLLKDRRNVLDHGHGAADHHPVALRIKLLRCDA